MPLRRSSTCCGIRYGLFLFFPRRSEGKRTFSTGLELKNPYLTADRRTLESTSRILSRDSPDKGDVAILEKYRWIESGVRSRRSLSADYRCYPSGDGSTLAGCVRRCRIKSFFYHGKVKKSDAWIEAASRRGSKRYEKGLGLLAKSSTAACEPGDVQNDEWLQPRFHRDH